MVRQAPQEGSPVVGRAGLRGYIVGHEGEAGAGGRVVIQLDEGGRLVVSSDLLVQREDGSYDLPLAPDELEPDSMERRIPLAEEELHVGKAVTERQVRVRVGVREREETIDVPLHQEHVSIERVPVNRVVDEPPAVREEEGVTIVPVLEEVVSVEKKLMVREEVRIHRQSEEVQHRERVTLRREEARIEREGENEGETQPPPSAGTEPAS